MWKIFREISSLSPNVVMDLNNVICNFVFMKIAREASKIGGIYFVGENKGFDEDSPFEGSENVSYRQFVRGKFWW